MAESPSDFVKSELDYLRDQDGSDFFLALGPCVEALDNRPEIHAILAALKEEIQVSLGRFVEEQNAIVQEAKAIRAELAERAPEIDNSDLEKPDTRSHAYTAWDLDSFA